MKHEPSEQPIRIAVLSYAHTGHAVSYSSALQRIPNTELAALWDDNPARGEEYARQFNTAYLPDLNRLLERSDIHAVIVCCETAQHPKLVCAAAQAGKHVLCEKPIATTLADGEAMIAACKTAGVLLQIAFVCRFYPFVQTARRLVQEGKYGRILGMVGGNRGTPPLPPAYPEWITDPSQAGGGALLDHSVHVTDAMRFILGDEVRSVYAETGRFRQLGVGVEDCGLMALTFHGGSIASVDPSWSMPENHPYHYDFYLRLLGEKGTLEIDDTRPTLHVVSDQPGCRPVNAEPFGLDVDCEMVRHFAACVRTGQHLFPAASGEDGQRALEIALAAYRSAQTHQPVALPLETHP